MFSSITCQKKYLMDIFFKSSINQVARGGHRKGILATHTCCAGGTWYVDLAEEEMKKTLGKL